MKNIRLPKNYTKFLWERGGKNPENEKFIGTNCVSWSQLETFTSKSGFNTGLKGEYEYIQKYFLGLKYPDMGWGTFGTEVEDYITMKESADKFSKKERETLNKIKPLGVFQEEILYYIEEVDTVVLGYIDDRSPEKNGKVKILRDYKTKSEASKKDLHSDKKHQFEIYILGLRQKGLEVESGEYCIIERLGGRECMLGGGREVLSVGGRIWYEEYNWDEKRLKKTHNLLVQTILQISECYKVYLKYFKN